MQKSLTVCVPSYNMENYLARCLDSLLVPECLEALEVIVVNDGSKDATLAVANGYANRFPHTVRVVDKENGHYGSCVNAALQIATGRYFRIVDADDWVDPSALCTVLKTLESIETDVLYTNYATFLESENRLAQNDSPADVKWSQLRMISELRMDHSYLHMHSLTYRTHLLREIGYRQTEGVCYSDTEYVYFPMVNAQTIYCENVSLYQYYMGRNDQSMAEEVQQRNFSHFYTITKSVLDYPKPANANGNYSYIRAYYFSLLLGFMLNIEKSNYFSNQKNEQLLRSLVDEMVAKKEDLSAFWSARYGGLFCLAQAWYKQDLLSKCLFFLYNTIRRLSHLAR